VEPLEERSLLSVGYVQTNLVSDIQGMAATTDSHLVNPWGLTVKGTSAFWVSNNNNGTSTLYTGQGAIVPLVVTIPTNTITTPPTLGSPSGTVGNNFGTGFDVVAGNDATSAAFLFDTEDGNIDAWAGGTTATVKVTNNAAGYKGLTLGTDSKGDNLLYAANFAQGTIDVFDATFALVEGAPGSNAPASKITLAGKFTDPNIPAGYAPFNVQNINGQLYVEYAKFDPTTTEGQPGAGGYVDIYSTDGVLLTAKRPLISNGPLNAPWGITVAPSNFGALSNDLLVGNFGNGWINAFNPTTGAFIAPLTLANGQPFQEDDLWALEFGNGATNKATGAVTAPTNTLYFTAGIDDQAHGLFGSLQAPAPITAHAPVLPNLPGTAVQTFPTNTTPDPTHPFGGDNNPYGVAFVPQGIRNGGKLQAGDLLVSNFNSSSGQQGTGTTIQLITPDGQTSTFFQGPAGLGLTTALGVLKNGFVLVGNVPTDANGVAQQGSLLILDGNGHVVKTLTDSALLDGPWDLALNDQGNFAQVFVSNVLSGTVTRIDLLAPVGGTVKVLEETQVASGYAHRTDPNALVVGPTGLAFDARSDTLYVASTADNAIFAVRNAAITHRDHGTGQAIVQNDPHLHGPLGLVLAPNGDLIVSNGDAVNPGGTANDLVEFDAFGDFVGSFQIDTGPSGAAFGIALSTDNGVIRFAAVDDNPDATFNKSNTVSVWTFGIKPTPPPHDHDHDDHDHHHDYHWDW
jgi:uncharacterized protein (TIGR03118 family)